MSEELDLQHIYFGEYIDFSKAYGNRRVKEKVVNGELPVFTIMMTVYNDTSLLSSAINTCLRQSFSSWELLVLDNSDKNDDAWLMIQNAMDYDGRIYGFRSEKNVGWAKGCEILLEYAKGEYVTFLSADDCLNPKAFSRIYKEIRQNQPDVIFVGNIYTNFVGWDNIENLGVVIPEYQVYDGKNRSEALAEIMGTTYYNSMFHYERREFLQKYGLNFFEPYYGDCATMTYAITKAEKIVVLDMPVYCLTMNTSQTAGIYSRLSVDYVYASQWRSARDLFKLEGYCNQDKIYYVASRIFNNYISAMKALCIGRWRDKYMKPLQATLDMIIMELENHLNSQDIGELFMLMGSRGMDGFIKNVASIKIFPLEEIEAAARDSWVYPLVKLAVNRVNISQEERLGVLCDFLLVEENAWCIGIYNFIEMAEKCDDDEWFRLRGRIESVVAKYTRLLGELNRSWIYPLIEPDGQPGKES